MRGFREIRVREVDREKKEKKRYAFQDIKPETDITLQDAQNFWNNYFASEIMEQHN